MTVAEAIEFLSKLPGDTKLVLEGSDHSYDPPRMFVTKAEIMYRDNGNVAHMWEYYDRGNMINKKNKIFILFDKKNKIEDVVVVGY